MNTRSVNYSLQGHLISTYQSTNTIERSKRAMIQRDIVIDRTWSRSRLLLSLKLFIDSVIVRSVVSLSC